MADGFDFRIETATTSRSLQGMQQHVADASIYTVRVAGARARSVARTLAPVYAGPRKDVPRGRLRRSIHADKTVTVTGAGEAAIHVSPRERPATLYARKEEARQPYMMPAYRAVQAQMGQIAHNAYARALREQQGRR